MIMKAYTDIKQSKKLAEILPLESADMGYIQDLLAGGKYGEYRPYIGNRMPAYGQGKIRCWSLAALLNYLREIGFFPDIEANKHEVVMSVWDCDREFNVTNFISVKADNFVDACYELIIKLHEQKLL